MFVASAMPAVDGGFVVDGTYVVTAAYAYAGADSGSGPTGATYCITNEVAAGKYALVDNDIDDAGNDGSTGRANGSFVASAGSITLTQSCPFTGTLAYTTYQATPTTVTLYAPDGRALVFTKQ